MMSFWEAARDCESRGESFVVVTLVNARGHAPQDPGAKAIMTAKGLEWGTIGGGKVEARAIQVSRSMLEKDPLQALPELVTWNLQRDIGMTCGGEVTFLFEVHRRDAWKITIFGAGHVAQALVRALEPLDCRITCIDPRREWIDRLPRSPKVASICSDEPAREVPKLPHGTFVVVMTQGHATDMPILDALLRSHADAPYVGAIGSDVKALKIRNELKERGFSESEIAKLHCPIGLPIGENHPAEIAISIAAQLLQVRDNRARTSSTLSRS